MMPVFRLACRHLVELDVSGDRDGKVLADRRTSLLPIKWHRGLEDDIILHRFKEGFRQQRHRSRVAPRPPRGLDPSSRKLYDYFSEAILVPKKAAPPKIPAII